MPTRQAHSPGRERRLEPLKGRAAERRGKLGKRLGQRSVHAAVPLAASVDAYSSPTGSSPNRKPRSTRTAHGEVDGLGIEGRQDRVERMLDDARIRTEAPEASPPRSTIVTRRAAIGEERRGCRADDPAADDDDIRTPLAHLARLAIIVRMMDDPRPRDRPVAPPGRRHGPPTTTQARWKISSRRW